MGSASGSSLDEHTHREHHDDRQQVRYDDAGAGAAPYPAAPQICPDRRGATGETATPRRCCAAWPAPRGRPAIQIQVTLRGSLTPLGVRLAPATLRELAAGIAAGRPVELP